MFQKWYFEPAHTETTPPTLATPRELYDGQPAPNLHPSTCPDIWGLVWYTPELLATCFTVISTFFIILHHHMYRTPTQHPSLQLLFLSSHILSKQYDEDENCFIVWHFYTQIERKSLSYVQKGSGRLTWALKRSALIILNLILHFKQSSKMSAKLLQIFDSSILQRSNGSSHTLSWFYGPTN